LHNYERKKEMSLKLIHRTRDGKELPIAAMDDKHLTNLLNLIYQKAMQIKNARKTGDTFKARLYGVELIDDETAADLMNELVEQGAPYFIEAYLRDLKEPQVMLRTLFERSARLEGFDAMPPLLGMGDVDMDVDDQVL
jgi:hypothetical protein